MQYIFHRKSKSFKFCAISVSFFGPLGVLQIENFSNTVSFLKPDCFEISTQKLGSMYFFIIFQKQFS